MSARVAQLMMVPTVRVREVIQKQRRYASVLGYFMTPVALAAYVLAFWRLGADLSWLDEFFIHQGLFSRWQVWLALAVATQLAAHHLNRLGSPDDSVASRP